MIFIGGMAEAKSKGRGEECISQNLRILRGHNGKRVMLFFANSQRGGLKRYVSIPRKNSRSYLPNPSIPLASACDEKLKYNLHHSQLCRKRQASEKARATGGGGT
jgi:hypothetical protein